MAMPRKWPRGFYVYFWCYPDCIPYYIGIGKGGRMGSAQRNRWAKHVYNKLEQNGTPTRIFYLEVPDRELAVLLERRLIQQYGRRHLGTGILVNITDGGDGGSAGRVLSRKARQSISRFAKNRVYSEKTRALISQSLKGNKRRLGIRHSQETRLKISLSGKGRVPSALAREKSAQRARERNISSPPMRGKVFSSEHKRKLSEAKRRLFLERAKSQLEKAYPGGGLLCT